MGDFSLATLIPTVLGVICLLASLWMISMHKHLHSACTARTRGEVIDLVECPVWDKGYETGRYAYAPVFRFVANGIEYSVTSGSSANTPEYEIGAVADVHYNPLDPNEAYIGKDSGLLIVAAVFGFVGVVMLIASIGFTVLGMLGYM